MEICYIEPEIKKDAKTNTPALAGGNEIEEVRGGPTAQHGNGHGLFRPGNPPDPETEYVLKHYSGITAGHEPLLYYEARSCTLIQRTRSGGQNFLS